MNGNNTNQFKKSAHKMKTALPRVLDYDHDPWKRFAS